MKKIALTVLLTLAAFVGPQLNSAETCCKWPLAGKSAAAIAMQKTQIRQKALIGKDGPDFKVLSKHGRLFFEISPRVPVDLPTSGQWQAFVIRPDGKKFHGPIIDSTNPTPLNFIITVEPPVLDGDYTLVFFNISTQYLSALTPYLEPISIKNSYNQDVAKIFETENAFLNPNEYCEIFFNPFRGH